MTDLAEPPRRGFGFPNVDQKAPIPRPGEVRSPLHLSPAQWWCVGRGVLAQTDRSNLALISAGVAFFGLMAIIPGLAAVVALFGLVGDPMLVRQQIAALGGVAPDDVITIIDQQVTRLLGANSGALLAGGIFNLALSLWSALQGVRWMLMALTIVNRRAEKRTMIRRFITAGVFTLDAIGIIIAAVLILGVAPAALTFLRMESWTETFILMLRWPVLGGAAIAGVLILYRWGPRRKPPPWKWLWPGAIAATLLWIVASSVLTFALREFPAFGAAYGSLASVIALLLWLYLSAYIFLLGGALNAELEFFAAGKPTPPVTGETAPAAAVKQKPSKVN